FGISTNAVMEVGREAARFTKDHLASEFTVITRWQNARGQGNLARYYAVVLVNGKNFAAELVEHGLARIHQPYANWPDGPRSSRFVSELKNLELQARERRVGAWDQRRFSKISELPSARDSHALLDLNAATFEDLRQLPGIGTILAQRIIAHRPYGSVEELKKVRGI